MATSRPELGLGGFVPLCFERFSELSCEFSHTESFDTSGACFIFIYLSILNSKSSQLARRGEGRDVPLSKHNSEERGARRFLGPQTQVKLIQTSSSLVPANWSDLYQHQLNCIRCPCREESLPRVSCRMELVGSTDLQRGSLEPY
jgi:hypothetical protein